MAFERGDRGYRFEQYPRRGESERELRGRGELREAYRRREIDDEDPGYVRSGEPRHWRGHDYYEDDDEFDRGRDSGRYEGPSERSLSAEHRERFLRRGQSEAAYPQRTQRSEWEGRQNFGRDDQWSGPYAGRGPKGYRRSDGRIHEDVCERLTDHPAIDATDIDVTVKDGDVTLSGRVESRAVKHLAETMVETVSGVKEVHNQLRVGASVTEPDWQSEGDLRTSEQGHDTMKTRRR